MAFILENDWLLAVTCTAFMVAAIFLLLASTGSLRRRANGREAATPDTVRLQFERTCRKLIDDLDRRARRLDELIHIADARIVELGSLNDLAVENRNKAAILSSAKAQVAPARPAYDEPQLKSHLLREIELRLERTLAEYKRDIADYKRGIDEIMEPFKVLSEPLDGPGPVALGDPSDANAEDAPPEPAPAVEAGAGFAPYEPDVAPADEDETEAMQKRMRDVERLALSGIPVDDICRTVRIERKAVETILRIAGIAPVEGRGGLRLPGTLSHVA